MATSGFHSEWVTFHCHRVLLHSRNGYPDDEMRFIAQVTVETVDHNSRHGPRLVGIFYDDKACSYTITIASDNPSDRVLADIVMNVLHTMRKSSDCQVEVVIVPPGNKDSEHYNHMEYLSRQAGRGAAASA